MTQSVGTVAALLRYPVKSMRGEALDAASLGSRGLAGDRAWAIVDADTGRIASAKRPQLWGGLLDCTAVYVREPGADGAPAPVRITLPTGREVSSEDPDCDAALSDWLGRPVRLVGSVPTDASYLVAEPEADDGAPERLSESAPGTFAPGTFFDSCSLHVVADGSLARMRAEHPGGRWDVRRFRPNVVVALDEPGDGFAEDAWLGRRLHLGAEAAAEVLHQMPRCVMTTVAQGGLERDPLVLRTIARLGRRELGDHGSFACLGAMSNVTAAGRVRRGDAVALGAL